MAGALGEGFKGSAGQADGPPWQRLIQGKPRFVGGGFPWKGPGLKWREGTAFFFLKGMSQPKV